MILTTTNGIMFPLMAQENDMTANDSIPLSRVDSVLATGLQDIDTSQWTPTPVIRKPFKPAPTRAVIYSALFPGLGQIYNRKYWKLPLVYGGFMGFAYAISWNNKNYRDYSDAYFYVSSDDPDSPESWNESWVSFVPAGRDPAEYIRDANFKSRLKNGKDFYRRYRDLSIILTVGWYLICVADAYVDAQLFDFDISDDLSLHVEPVFYPQTAYSSRLYGVSCSIKF
ncbi:MAG: DUF5683 domain-containing protein [Tannerella sp.]|jgi:hypothetical protein|nr:DUF5683 domain-containing protein [Tannerella sp.]